MPDRQALRQAVRDATIDNQAACKALLALARREGVPPLQIGRLCDEMEIKIVGCQLGCFGQHAKGA